MSTCEVVQRASIPFSSLCSLMPLSRYERESLVFDLETGGSRSARTTMVALPCIKAMRAAGSERPLSLKVAGADHKELL